MPEASDEDIKLILSDVKNYSITHKRCLTDDELKTIIHSKLTIIWVGLYTFAFQQFGFLFPTMVFLLGEMYLFGEKRWKVLVSISILLPIIFYFLFTKVFGIYLP